MLKSCLSAVPPTKYLRQGSRVQKAYYHLSMSISLLMSIFYSSHCQCHLFVNVKHETWKTVLHKFTVKFTQGNRKWAPTTIPSTPLPPPLLQAQLAKLGLSQVESWCRRARGGLPGPSLPWQTWKDLMTLSDRDWLALSLSWTWQLAWHCQCQCHLSMILVRHCQCCTLTYWTILLLLVTTL